MADHMLARGGELKMNQRISKILLNDDKTVSSIYSHHYLDLAFLNRTGPQFE